MIHMGSAQGGKLLFVKKILASYVAIGCISLYVIAIAIAIRRVTLYIYGAYIYIRINMIIVSCSSLHPIINTILRHHVWLLYI